MHKGLENIEEIKNETGDVVLVKEKREFDGGARKGTIVIRVSSVWKRTNCRVIAANCARRAEDAQSCFVFFVFVWSG